MSENTLDVYRYENNREHLVLVDNGRVINGNYLLSEMNGTKIGPPVYCGKVKIIRGNGRNCHEGYDCTAMFALFLKEEDDGRTN